MSVGFSVRLHCLLLVPASAPQTRVTQTQALALGTVWSKG